MTTSPCAKTLNLAPGGLAVVVGAARSGLAAARLLSHLGLKVRIVDIKEPAQAVAEEAAAQGWEFISGPHEAAQFAGANIIVPSPGVPLPKIEAHLSAGQRELIVGEMELAYTLLRGEPILAVTGTSGKTTTVSIAAAMLEAAGKKVFLGGNIGTPLSEYVLGLEQSGKGDDSRADVLVLEISSFQLQTCQTFKPKVAVLLNISENHLDHHKDMREYTEAKFRLFNCQDAADFAILSEELREMAAYSLPGQVEYFTATGRFPKTRLLGAHNQLNLEAAFLACAHFGVDLPTAAKAAAEFAPLAHRLEAVAEKNGVLFVNDSKSTTVDSLRVALEAMDRPVRLLAGGVFKGGDLQSLAPLLRGKVRQVALFGQSREIFEQAWQSETKLSWHPALREACVELWAAAAPGDVILLSPATASFDLYKNYKARGDDFRRIVEDLK